MEGQLSLLFVSDSQLNSCAITAVGGEAGTDLRQVMVQIQKVALAGQGLPCTPPATAVPEAKGIQSFAL